MTLYCPQCRKDRTALLSWQAMHLRADCAHCGTYISYLRQTPENVALAPPRGVDQPRTGQDRQQLTLFDVPTKTRGSWEMERAKLNAERR